MKYNKLIMEILINSLNFYPHPVLLQYNKKSEFYTIYGLLFSALTYCLIFFLIYYFSYDLLNFTNPKVKINQSELNHNITMTADKLIEKINLVYEMDFYSNNDIIDIENIDNSFKLILAIISKNSSIDGLYFINPFNSTIMKKNSSSNGYIYQAEFLIYEESNMKNNDLEVSDGRIKTNLSKKLKDIEFNIKNSFLSLYLIIHNTENITQYNTTKFEYGINLFDRSIETENIYNSSNKINKNLYTEKYEYFQLLYGMIQLQSDENPIFSEKKIENIPQLNFFTISSGIVDYSDNKSTQSLLKIEFREVMQIYIRTYKKILDVLSELGGIFNPLLIVGKLLIFQLNDKIYKISILNNLFKDEDINRDINKFQKIKDNQAFRKEKIINKKSLNFDSNIIGKEDVNLDEYKDITDKYTYKNVEFKNMKIIDEKKEIENFYEKNDLSFAEKLNSSFKISKIENFNERKSFYSNLFNYNFIKKLRNDVEIDINKIVMDNQKPNQSLYNTKKIKETEKNLLINESKENKELLMKDEDLKNQIKSYLNSNKNKNYDLLKYSSHDIVLSFICCKKCFKKNLLQKEEIYCKMIEKFNYYLEITNIMRLNQGFEKIKFILFNRNQIESFDYMINDINYNAKKREEDILFELGNYFEKADGNFIEKYFDESIKIVIKNDIKKLILKE